MKPRLHLHIGHGKVASSSIQAALIGNAEALREQGFLLADRDLDFPTAGRVRGTPGALLAEFRTKGEDGLAEFLRRMESALHTAQDSGKKLVLSSEQLVVSPMEAIAQPLGDHFELHVHYYIRRQDDWLISAWKQWGIKDGLSIEAFVANRLADHRPNFRLVVERWQPAATSFRLRPLHRAALHQGDIVADFFHAIGCVRGRTDIASINRSFDLSLLEVMAANPSMFEGLHDDRMFQFLERNLPREMPVERATLDAETRARIHAEFEQDNRELHARFFSDCDFDTVFGPKKSEGHHPASSEVERLRRALGVQLGITRQLEERIRQLEARVDGSAAKTPPPQNPTR